MIDAKTIEELRGLLAKATPGPWSTHLVDDTTIISPTREVATTCDSVQAEREDGYNIEYEQMEADAALIVAMRSALPALLDVAERLKEVTRERDQWQQRESETQEALQAIGEDFGAHGGEPRTDAMRRLLTEAAALASRAREDALREAADIAYMAPANVASDSHEWIYGYRDGCLEVAGRIRALIDKPEGGDANDRGATSPDVKVGASAGWRPIETAPVDLDVLLYCPNLGVANPERIEFGPAHTSRGSHHAWATMWMPLPAAPVDGGEDA